MEQKEKESISTILFDKDNTSFKAWYIRKEWKMWQMNSPFHKKRCMKGRCYLIQNQQENYHSSHWWVPLSQIYFTSLWNFSGFYCPNTKRSTFDCLIGIHYWMWLNYYMLELKSQYCDFLFNSYSEIIVFEQSGLDWNLHHANNSDKKKSACKQLKLWLCSKHKPLQSQFTEP